MTTRTRSFVIVSLLVLFVGLGTGLVAYYVGFPTNAFFSSGGPDELRLLPRTAAVVAYADVAEVMNSSLRQRLRQVIAPRLQEDGQREFENATGINIETDIDHVVWCLDANAGNVGSAGTGPNGLVIARGRFNTVKIEALMRDHGAGVEEYRGKRLIVAADPKGGRFSLAFMEPGLIAIGAADLVRHAVDLQTNGGESARTNDELMEEIRSLDNGNAWAVGRFDLLRSQANLPPVVANQLPPITWFAASGRVDSGLRAVLRAEARDEEAATNLRDVVRGFVALAKMQAGSKPAVQGLVQSIELGGTGKTVALSFDLSAQALDALIAAAPTPQK